MEWEKEKGGSAIRKEVGERHRVNDRERGGKRVMEVREREGGGRKE